MTLVSLLPSSMIRESVRAPSGAVRSSHGPMRRRRGPCPGCRITWRCPTNLETVHLYLKTTRRGGFRVFFLARIEIRYGTQED
jgi:hypothetical protein